MEKTNMDSLVTVLAAVEKLGFQSQFEVNGKNLVSLKTDQHFLSTEVKIAHYYRFEGESSPDDSSIMYAIECNTGEKGTLIDGYGPSANLETANFITTVNSIKK
ncbi:hypothetical protein [Flavobacterium crassostreae]|uniref:Phosphoribosylpyrophosphate synthetase n=1 Tax=Flavobacterium crassostreae TaxID=1763534 RepID=A0A1B9E994_9FLAO|nr:hypothetical protein [Flavobacterium crassostreae]OCB78519.1 hypothetical protein LPBF_00535 [Flavobacterium crassostreae]